MRLDANDIELYSCRLAHLESFLPPDEKEAYERSCNNILSDIIAYDHRYHFTDMEKRILEFSRKARNLENIIFKIYETRKDSFRTIVRRDGTMVVAEIEMAHGLADELNDLDNQVLDEAECRMSYTGGRG